MFRNYLTIAIRNLLRYKIYSLINIVGLAIGISCCTLILLYVKDELSYDNFHTQTDQIYRVLRETKTDNGNVITSSGLSGPFAPALLEDFPEVKNAVRMVSSRFDLWPQYQGKPYHQGPGSVLMTESGFFDVFDVPFILGNETTALQEPLSLVISDVVAQRYFGEDNPLGKTISLELSSRMLLKVTGVMRVPQNTSLKYEMVISSPTQWQDEWMNHQWHAWQQTNTVRPIETYIVLHKDTNPKSLDAKLPNFIARHMGAEIQSRNTYRLQPLHRIHLHTYQDYGQLSENNSTPITVYGDIYTLYVLSAVALLILLIACVNFTNLATARSTHRAREVGLRKVAGAHRRQLTRQFLGEAFLLSMVAMLLAGCFIEMTLPTFNAFVGKQLSFLGNAYHIFIMLSFLGSVGLLSGIYPAFFLSSIEPASVLKGRLSFGSKSILLRKGLVVFQFAISILLIIGTLTVYRQLDYMQNKKLGFDKEYLVTMPIFRLDKVKDHGRRLGSRLSNRYPIVKQAFLRHPNILSATAYRREMGDGGVFREWKMNNGDVLQVLHQEVDMDFWKTFDIDLIAGNTMSYPQSLKEARSFSNNRRIIVNETAVKMLGLEDPIGKQISRPGSENIKLTIVGVAKDFHSQSLHKTIPPMAFTDKASSFEYLTLKMRSENLTETIAFLEQTWNRFLPEVPFQFGFLDESLAQLYRKDQKVGQLVSTFTGLAILVACLGLFGLAAFTVEQRTKEIGVRKIMGASVPNIIFLLSKDFIALVLLANIVAWPISYIVTGDWLQNFAYRVEWSWRVFALSGAATLMAALGTVGYQAIRAGFTNPVEALRNE